MKYHQIITTLTSEPLLITPASAISLFELFKQHASLSAEEWAKREGVDSCGGAVELDQMEIRDGVAHIPIGGPIGSGLSKFEKGAGAVDVEDIANDLQAAEEDDEVRVILLDIDSPGGMVTGTPETADRIAAVEKPIYAFTRGLIASAAYWMAASTDGIFSTKSADIGSIGVYIPWVDVSEALRKEGVKVELFTSGAYKGMGYPGTTLTKEQRALLKDRVTEIADMFYSHVRGMRPDVSDQAMQGQTFKGYKALEQGLVDYIVRDKSEVLEII